MIDAEALRRARLAPEAGTTDLETLRRRRLGLPDPAPPLAAPATKAAKPVVLTDADAAADLAGTPRPDNPTVRPAPAPVAPAPVFAVTAAAPARGTGTKTFSTSKAAKAPK